MPQHGSFEDLSLPRKPQATSIVQARRRDEGASNGLRLARHQIKANKNCQRLYSLYRLGGHLSASMVGIAMVTRQIF